MAELSNKEVWFYHTMDLPGIGTVAEGNGWDLRGRFDGYIGNVKLNGKTLLDVGTASGFLSFEAERRGAIVTSFDAGTIEDRDDSDAKVDDRDFRTRELKLMHNGYEIAHRAFKSKAKIARGSVYKLSNIVSQHDVVLVAQILVHLKDPWAAVQQAAACSSDTLIIVEGSFESSAPIAQHISEPLGFWHISDELYRVWLDRLGFGIVSVSQSLYPHIANGIRTEHGVWTFIARRKELLPHQTTQAPKPITVTPNTEILPQRTTQAPKPSPVTQNTEQMSRRQKVRLAWHLISEVIGLRKLSYNSVRRAVGRRVSRS